MHNAGPMGDRARGERVGEEGRRGVLPTVMPAAMRPTAPGGGGGGGGDEGREGREEGASSYRPPAPCVGSCAGHGATLTLTLTLP